MKFCTKVASKYVLRTLERSVLDYEGLIFNGVSYSYTFPAKVRAVLFDKAGAHGAGPWYALYRGASLIRNCFLLGPYSRPMPRTLWSGEGEGVSYERGAPLFTRQDPFGYH